jgi:hypothetical protein
VSDVHSVSSPQTPLMGAARPKPSAFVPALTALLLPVAAFVLAWAYAGKILMPAPKAQWGIWFAIGALMGVAGIAGSKVGVKVLMRGDYRSMAVTGLALNLVVVLIAWAGWFA